MYGLITLSGVFFNTLSYRLERNRGFPNDNTLSFETITHAISYRTRVSGVAAGQVLRKNIKGMVVPFNPGY